MTRYSNRSEDSGISRYEIQGDGIIIQFSTGAKYLYTNVSAGNTNIEKMKELAIIGEGLNSFINKHVKKLYESKIN